MRLRGERGFTLVELMVVVTVLGILSAIAASTFISSIQRARSAEAALNLKAIAACQAAHFGLRGQYYPADASPPGDPTSIRRNWEDPAGKFSDIGFRPEGGVYFQYVVDTDPSGLAFTAAARANLDGDDRHQVWALRVPSFAGDIAVDEAFELPVPAVTGVQRLTPESVF